MKHRKKTEEELMAMRERIIRSAIYLLIYVAASILNLLVNGEPLWKELGLFLFKDLALLLFAINFFPLLVSRYKCKVWHFACVEAIVLIINIGLSVWMIGCSSLFSIVEIELSTVCLIALIGNPYIEIKARERIEKVKLLEDEKRRIELYYLNLQLNPHFLFNTLNVIYIQARKEKALASADMVMQLSDLLRYQLYESVDKKVLIKSDIKYIENYLELQKIRKTDVNIDYQKDGNFDGVMIYPFLSISFLENAFKYVCENSLGEKFIKIFIGVDEKNVSFAICNTKCDTPVATTAEKAKSSGIGIENTKKRLDLLCPGKYTLNISNDDKYFNVELKIVIEND